MGSLTTWNRMEPRTRSETLPGLQARIADPLWLLAVQWQSGEPTGAAPGTPAAWPRRSPCRHPPPHPLWP